MDTGYLSRLVTGLDDAGLIKRVPSEENAKRLALTLTPKGRDVFSGLDKASAEEAAGVLAPLSDSERRELVGAMSKIRRLLGDVAGPPMVILRDPEPGDLGLVTAAQARLY